jgi:hypothetical protein
VSEANGKPAAEALPGALAAPPVPLAPAASRSDGAASTGLLPASANGTQQDNKERPNSAPGGLPTVPLAPPPAKPPLPNLSNPPPPVLPLDDKGLPPPPPAVTPPAGGPLDIKPVVPPVPKIENPPPATGAALSGAGKPELSSTPPPPPVAPAGAGMREKGNALAAGNGLEVRPAVPPPAVGERSQGSLPPLGATGGVVAAPIAVQPPPVAPKPAVELRPRVLQYDVRSHSCTAADTSFEKLAQDEYHSKRYADALLQFNRTYLRGDDALKKDPPQLAPGVVIYFPPAHILEENYSIAGLPPLSPPRGTASSGSSQTAVGGERAAVAVPVRPSGVIPARAESAPGGTKVYRVQAPQGEMLFTIAERTLGDGYRWNQIQRLNPNLVPSQPVPQGTTVILPADARVD